MGMTFLILFAVAEITLVVMTFTKFGEKSAWLKNRVIVRAVETAFLLGMILIPAVNFKWRFFGALTVVAVRFILAGIMWLIRRKKIQGMKKKAWSVVNCVISVMLVAVFLVPAFIFTTINEQIWKTAQIDSHKTTFNQFKCIASPTPPSKIDN